MILHDFTYVHVLKWASLLNGLKPCGKDAHRYEDLFPPSVHSFDSFVRPRFGSESHLAEQHAAEEPNRTGGGDWGGAGSGRRAPGAICAPWKII